MHRQGLGNTGILEQALASGAIDLYPEYTGTIVRELLKRDGNPRPRRAERVAGAARAEGGGAARLQQHLCAGDARGARARARHHDDLRPAAAGGGRRCGSACRTNSCERADGWPALKAAYGAAAQADGGGLDHGLAYDAVAAGRVDVIDVYSTDAKIGRYAPARARRTTATSFPKYDAVLLMRAGGRPDAAARGSQGRIDAATMIAMNAAGRARRRAASPRRRASFLAGGFAAAARAAARGARPASRQRLLAPDLRAACSASTCCSCSARSRSRSRSACRSASPPGAGRAAPAPLLGAVAVLQTMPSLALLAFLIALVGSIGFVPALIALFLYALLPIVRNTHAGLRGVPRGLRAGGAVARPDAAPGARARRSCRSPRRRCSPASRRRR